MLLANNFRYLAVEAPYLGRGVAYTPFSTGAHGFRSAK
jgi:hypothetical protein